jgi:signal transduction histidine kinase
MYQSSIRTTAIGSLTRGLVLTVIITIVLFNLFFYFLSTQQFQADLQARTSTSATELATLLAPALWNFDERTIDQTANVYAELEDVVQLRVTDNTGEIFYDYSVEIAVVASTTKDVYFEDNLVGQVEIGFSSFGLEIAQRDRLISTVFSTLFVVIAIIIASQILLRRFIQRPLTDVMNGLTIIGRGDYTHRLPLFQKTDLDTIITSINDMASQIADRDHKLRQLVDSLEERVVGRTRDLTIAEGIAREITMQLSEQDLLNEIALVTQAAFDLYQVNLYVFEPDTKLLKLTAAAGAAGETMLAQGKQHQLDGKGLVPTAATLRAPAISNDVAQSADHLFNPLLPETRSEAAFPLLFGDTLYGVLDLQSVALERFDESAVALFGSFSNQIAIAMRNAALFEEAKASRQRAEESDRVKSAFLASMSHELRTPLNAIINFAKFMRRQVPGPLNEEQGQLITNIVDSGQHLLNLINDVLDMSKIESGALKLYIEPNLDLRDIVSNAVNYVQPIIAEKPVTLERTLPDALPAVSRDRRRLLQVFINIMSNACKFTEAGKVNVGAQVKNNRVVISITDTGPGIAREDAEYVFTAFKQTDTGLRQGGGTGLGMPISKRLIEAHQGRIWFESEVGHGTTFFVELPLEAASSLKAA